MRWVAAVLVLVAATAASAHPHRICWDGSPDATGYRIYWGTDPTWWTPMDMVETEAMCIDDPTPEPEPDAIVYFIVTAFNANAESETEHGPIS